MSGRWMMITSLAWLAAVDAAAKTHVDKDAGLSFTDPFKKSVAQSPRELDAANANPAAAGAGVRYTSGLSLGGAPPMIRVWIKSAEGQLTRAAVKTFAEGDADLIFKMLGIQNFKFDKKKLRGAGDLPDVSGLKSKIVMQLVKDQYSYDGFFYKKEADLKLLDKVKSSLKVLPAMKLDVKKLPAGGGSDMLKSTLFGMLVGSVIGGIAGTIWYLTRKKKKKTGMGMGPDSGAEPPAVDLAS